jgi:hypothetical protein
MGSRFIILLLLLGAGACSQAPTSAPSNPLCVPTTGGDFAFRSYQAPLSVADAQRILVCTTWFELRGQPRQGQAFNVLFEQPDPVAQFRLVVAQGGPAGRLYALAALQILSAEEAGRLAQELARDTRRVLARDGDVMLGSRPASELVSLVKTRHIGEQFRANRDAIAATFNKAG